MVLIVEVSIHAPREGSDKVTHPFVGDIRKVSIHAPREGSDRNPIPVWR